MGGRRKKAKGTDALLSSSCLVKYEFKMTPIYLELSLVRRSMYLFLPSLKSQEKASN